MFNDLREWGRGRGRERETLMWERNIYQLPSIGTLTRNQTCNLLVYRTTPQWSHLARTFLDSSRKDIALAGWLSWLEHHPAHEKAAGLIIHQGTCLGCKFDPWLGCIQEATHWCFSLTLKFLSLSLPLPVPLKSINISSGEDYNKIRWLPLF